MDLDLDCPLTLELLRDPVFCADGHTYEREAIEDWLRAHETSPKTGLRLKHKHLVPNYQCRSLVEGRAASLLSLTPTSRRGGRQAAPTSASPRAPKKARCHREAAAPAAPIAAPRAMRAPTAATAACRARPVGATPTAGCRSSWRGGGAEPAALQPAALLNAQPTIATTRGSGGRVGSGGAGGAGVKFKRPPGRAPSGKVWETEIGEWVVTAPQSLSFAASAASFGRARRSMSIPTPPPAAPAALASSSCCCSSTSSGGGGNRAVLVRLNDVEVRDALVAVGRVTLPLERVRRAAARTAACRDGASPKGGLWLPLEVRVVVAAGGGGAEDVDGAREREGMLVGALRARGLALHVIPATVKKLGKLLAAGAAEPGVGALEIVPNLAVGHAMKTDKEECGAVGHTGCWVKPWPSAFIRESARWCG